MKQTKHNIKIRTLLIPLIIIITNLGIRIDCQISLMNYYQSQHILAHVIKSVKQNRIQSAQDQYEQKCINTNHCCLCNKQFKNSSYLELHFNVHHPIGQEKPQDYMLQEMFDKKTSKEFRFQTCLKYFDFVNVTTVIKKQEQIWDQKRPQVNQPNNLIAAQLFNTRLTILQTVDICTLITYGSYQEPLWFFWLKCILIFMLAIVFLVYFANMLDMIRDYYFPKKKGLRNTRISSTNSQGDSDNDA